MQTIKRQKRSEKLTKEERAGLKKWVNAQDTKVDACDQLAFTLPTLDRIMLKGSGNPDSIAKIRAKINP